MDEQAALAKDFKQFLFWDAIACVVSTIALTVTYVFFRTPFLLVTLVEIALYIVLLAWAWRRAQRGDFNKAAGAIALGILIIALSIGLMATVAVSVAALLSVLSVMLGLPYMNGPTLKRLITGVLLVLAALASFALTGNGLTPLPTLPTWVLASILGVGVPATGGLVFVLVLQYSSRLRETIDQTATANGNLDKTTQLLEGSRRRLVNAQEELRREVAQQLHGPVQNRLLVANHWLQSALEKMNSDSAESAVQIKRATELIDDINAAGLRVAVRRLHPSLIRMSLKAALESLISEFQDGFDVGFTVDQRDPETEELWRRGLPEDLRLVIYRVAEEALGNALKHSTATKVDLTLRRASDHQIEMTVRDNGIGFDVNATAPGFGILSMQDYCGSASGNIQIISEAGAGTALISSFPVLVVEENGRSQMEEAGLHDYQVPPLSNLATDRPESAEPVSTATVSNQVKVLIVDDQPDYCNLVSEVLSSYKEFAIVGTCLDGVSALRLVEAHKPDLVLLDIEMPGVGGLEIARTIDSRWPEVRSGSGNLNSGISGIAA